jgi:hypothetical protein
MPDRAKTTRETVKARQTGIEFELLPRTLRDAIHVTRSLRIPFIWIDALCIIQGDIEDWEKECEMMAEVYSHAIVMIAAGSAEHCNQGFIIQEKPTIYKDFGQKRLLALSNFNSTHDYLDGLRSSPLHLRGWTLQESELSTRIIHFRSDHIVWQCRQQHLCYLTPFRHQAESIDVYGSHDLLKKHHLSRCFDISVDRFEAWSYEDKRGINSHVIDEAHIGGKILGTFKALWRRNIDGADVYYEDAIAQFFNARWRRMIEDFTSRKLTLASDKLPALLGLVVAAQRHIQSEYLAGLWKNDLKNDLLWLVQGSTEEDYVHPPFPSFYAPSWSWASTNFGVSYPYSRVTHAPVNLEDWSEEATRTHIIETHIAKQGPYCLPGCFIRLRAQLRHFAQIAQGISWADSGAKEMKLFLDDGSYRWYRSLLFRVDVRLSDVCNYIVCKIMIRKCFVHGLSLAGLILEKTGGVPNKYKRVGMAYDIPEDWFKNVALSEIVII